MNHCRIHIVIATLICSLHLGSSGILHAQDSAAPAEKVAPPPAAVSNEKHEDEKKTSKDKTFIDVLKDGGIVMYPLGLLSVVMVTLILDGFYRLRNSKL